MDSPRKKKLKCEIKKEKRTPTELKLAPLAMWRESSTPPKKKQREESGPARNKISDPCTLLDSLKEEELAMQDKAIAASVKIWAWPRCDFENKARNPTGESARTPPIGFQQMHTFQIIFGTIL